MIMTMTTAMKAKEYFKHLEDLEQDELFSDDVFYHFQTAMELEGTLDYCDIESIYDQYKRYKAQKNQVGFLKCIAQPPQRSPAWYKMRESMLTASNIAPILGECAYGSAKKVLLDKAGISKDTFVGNFATKWGVKYEPVACKIYELRTKTHINDFGLLPHYSTFQPQDDFAQPITFIGASPDGISDEGIMLEIKCPTSREITGIPPRNYWVQMQIQMEVCNLDMCHFLECKFSEYAQEKDFLANLNTSSTGNEKEKGVVSYFEETEKYEYLFPLPKKISEIEKWCDERRALGAIFSFFELDKYSCVEVPRDFDWFVANLPALKTFWREVLYARKHPEKYMKKHAASIGGAGGAGGGSSPTPPAKKRAVSAASAATASSIYFDPAELQDMRERTKHLTSAQLDAMAKERALAQFHRQQQKQDEEQDEEQEQKQEDEEQDKSVCLIDDDDENDK